MSVGVRAWAVWILVAAPTTIFGALWGGIIALLLRRAWSGPSLDLQQGFLVALAGGFLGAAAASAIAIRFVPTGLRIPHTRRVGLTALAVLATTAALHLGFPQTPILVLLGGLAPIAPFLITCRIPAAEERARQLL